MSDLFLLKVRSLSGKIINYGDNFALTSLNFNLCLQDSHKYLLVLEATCFVYHCEYINLFIYFYRNDDLFTFSPMIFFSMVWLHHDLEYWVWVLSQSTAKENIYKCNWEKRDSMTATNLLLVTNVSWFLVVPHLI